MLNPAPGHMSLNIGFLDVYRLGIYPLVFIL